MSTTNSHFSRMDQVGQKLNLKKPNPDDPNEPHPNDPVEPQPPGDPVKPPILDDTGLKR